MTRTQAWTAVGDSPYGAVCLLALNNMLRSGGGIRDQNAGEGSGIDSECRNVYCSQRSSFPRNRADLQRNEERARDFVDVC